MLCILFPRQPYISKVTVVQLDIRLQMVDCSITEVTMSRDIYHVNSGACTSLLCVDVFSTQRLSVVIRSVRHTKLSSCHWVTYKHAVSSTCARGNLKNFRWIFFATWYQIRSSAADNNSSILAATMYNVVEEFLENYRLFISTAWPLVVLVWIVSTWDTGERVLESCSALGAWECGPLWTLFLSSLDMLDQRMAPSTYSRLFVSGTLEKGFWKLVQH